MKKSFRSKNLKYAIPFLIFMVGGSFGLREFTALRYRYRSVESFNVRDEVKKLGMSVKSPVESTLEAQYEELKQSESNEWDNKRIPRPKGWN